MEELHEKLEKIEQEEKAEPNIDLTLLKLNIAIQRALMEYFPKDVPEDQQVKFTFDLPDQEHLENATISVFLYDLQEDLQLRSGESRHYNPVTGKQTPGLVHVRCCYLLTYWPKDRKASNQGPDSESIRAINRVLNALLNRRTFEELPGSYTRVIPPSEQLNSLGTFWQALGNKPRLCLSYAVTIPIQLRAEKVEAPPVKAVSVEFNKKAVGETLEQVAADLWQRLSNALCAKDPQHRKTLLQALARVTLRCEPQLDRGTSYLRLIVSGVTTPACKAALLKELGLVEQSDAKPQPLVGAWSEKPYRVAGSEMKIEEVQANELMASAADRPANS